MSAHSIVHIELSSTNRKQSTAFYSQVFDWHTQHFEEMDYTMFSTGENELGGGFNPAPQNMPVGSTVIYIGTKDIDTTLSQIEANGGKTIRPKDEIPGMGWFALFEDPSGNTLGLFTALEGGG